MKNIIQTAIFISISGFCVQAFAQKRAYEANPGSITSPVKATAADDTLGLAEFLNDGNNYPTMYAVDGGSGYIVGNNNYDDKQKAQQYSSSGLYVKKIIFWFGRKEYSSGNSGSKIIAKLYDLDGTGVSTAGPTSAPGTVRAAVDVAISTIDTSGGFTVVNLSSPVFVSGNFAVGFDVTSVANGDYIGCVSTRDGETAVDNLSWEQQDNNSWRTIMQAWTNLDIDFAIFPVVATSLSIDDNYFIDGLKLNQNQPNPAISETIISYEIQNANDVTLEVVDVTGKQVMLVNEGLKVAGKHNIVLNTEKLASGTYYYTLKTNDTRLTRKMLSIK